MVTFLAVLFAVYLILSFSSDSFVFLMVICLFQRKDIATKVYHLEELERLMDRHAALL